MTTSLKAQRRQRVGCDLQLFEFIAGKPPLKACRSRTPRPIRTLVYRAELGGNVPVTCRSALRNREWQLFHAAKADFRPRGGHSPALGADIRGPKKANYLCGSRVNDNVGAELNRHQYGVSLPDQIV